MGRQHAEVGVAFDDEDGLVVGHATDYKNWVEDDTMNKASVASLSTMLAVMRNGSQS